MIATILGELSRDLHDSPIGFTSSRPIKSGVSYVELRRCRSDPKLRRCRSAPKLRQCRSDPESTPPSLELNYDDRRTPSIPHAIDFSPLCEIDTGLCSHRKKVKLHQESYTICSFHAMSGYDYNV